MTMYITHKQTKFKIGDTVAVQIAFVEGDKKKTQIFEGIVIKTRGRKENKMFTVRKMTRDKIGVERIFPLLSPNVEKISVVKKGCVRRAKIGFIRNLSQSQIREKLYTN